MPFNMVHSDQRKVSGVGNRLRFSHSHKQCSDKSRSVCHRYRVNIIQGTLCFRKCLFDYLVNFLYMFSGSNFRHNSSIQLVQINLRGNNIRKHFSPISHNCRCRFITGAFYCKYCNIFFFAHLPTSITIPGNPDLRSSGLFPPLRKEKSSVLRPSILPVLSTAGWNVSATSPVPLPPWRVSPPRKRSYAYIPLPFSPSPAHRTSPHR